MPLYNTCCCGNAIVLGYTRHVILCERGSGGKIMRWRDGRDRGRGGGEKDGEGERRREREREREREIVDNFSPSISTCRSTLPALRSGLNMWPSISL